MPRHISRATIALCLSMMLAANGAAPAFAASPQDALPTATPIKHLVVIFGENESFDHYFGTYPNATNPPGEPAFTALWTYAQHFAMSDNSYSTTFGPSTPGAVNLISGQTNGAVGYAPSNGSSSNTINNIVADGQGGFTMYGDSDPHGDVCSSTTNP